jgi:hypothetical protein
MIAAIAIAVKVEFNGLFAVGADEFVFIENIFAEN